MTGPPELGAATWPDVEAWAASLLAVPVGSTEQHGPHLPLSTDTDIATELCRRLACAVDGVVVAPALAYGASGEHESFPGTVSMGSEALEVVVVELCRSASRHFGGVILVNAHGGNGEALRRAARLVESESRRVLVWHAHAAGDLHAGRTETSLSLAIHADRVRLDRAVAGDRRPLAVLLPAMRAGGLAAVSANGVLGDPAGASAAEGEALLRSMAADLVAAVTGWR